MPHRASAARILVHGQHPPQHSASDGVTLALDGLHDLRDIFLAGVVVGGFHHHAHQGLRQIAHRQLFRQYDLHHLQTGRNAVIGAGVLAEDDINYYFSSIRMLSSMSVNILVAYLFLQYK